MRRFVLLGFILFICSAGAFAQSDETSALKSKLDNLTLSMFQNGGTATPFGYSYQANKPQAGPTAALQTGLQGTWWREQHWIKELNLTSDQQKKMDDAFRQNKIKLIDMSAALEKEELMLEPLVQNVNPGDEGKILAGIDRVADARAGLEKANARMLLAIRQIMTQEQWDKLQSQNKFQTRGKTIFFSGDK